MAFHQYHLTTGRTPYLPDQTPLLTNRLRRTRNVKFPAVRQPPAKAQHVMCWKTEIDHLKLSIHLTSHGDRIQNTNLYKISVRYRTLNLYLNPYFHQATLTIVSLCFITVKSTPMGSMMLRNCACTTWHLNESFGRCLSSCHHCGEIFLEP